MNWETLACELDTGPAPVANIGLIALGYDTVIEGELRAFLPAGVGVTTTRVVRQADGGEISRAAALFQMKIDVMAYGCTSGAAELGSERVAAAVHAGRTGVPVCDPASAAALAVNALGIGRLALLTPYVDEESEKVAAYLAGQGIHVVTQASFKQPNETIDRIAPASLISAATSLGGRDVDGLFMSCAGLRTSGIIVEVEQRIGKPVVSSVQALAWQCLRLAGCAERKPGLGRLMIV